MNLDNGSLEPALQPINHLYADTLDLNSQEILPDHHSLYELNENNSNSSLFKSKIPKQIETITSSTDNFMLEYRPKRKYSDIDDHWGAFKHLQETKKERSKSFNLDKPVPPTFHPVIVSTENQQKCSNKLCSRLSVEGTFIKIKNKKNWLCNDCLSLFQKEQYCAYCYQIYQDTSNIGAVVDGLEWIQCESCMKWLHVDCEATNRTADIVNLIKSKGYRFQCHACSNKKKHKINRVYKKEKKRHLTQSYSINDCYEYSSGMCFKSGFAPKKKTKLGIPSRNSLKDADDVNRDLEVLAGLIN